MHSIGNHPQGFFAGAFGIDPNSDELLATEDQGPFISHLSAVFGLVEVNAELIDLLDVPKYRAAWLKYCRLYNADQETQKAELGRPFKTHLRAPHSRLTAFAAANLASPEIAKRAWQEFNTTQEFARLWSGKPGAVLTVDAPQVLNPVEEAPWLSTNDASQWALAAMQNLALISEYLEK
jgi:hypothetical protein